MSDIEFPTAYCPTCKEVGPVVLEDIPAEVAGFDFQAIYCPGCQNVLNIESDVEVKWYTEEELPKATGWKVKKNADTVPDT